MSVSNRVWGAVDTDSFDVSQHQVTKSHREVQLEIDEYGVESIVGQLLRGNVANEYGMAIYADSEIDCFTVPPGFIDRLCRRAGVDPYVQRAIFNAYYELIDETEFDVPPFADIIIVDKTIVSGYEEEE